MVVPLLPVFVSPIDRLHIHNVRITTQGRVMFSSPRRILRRTFGALALIAGMSLAGTAIAQPAYAQGGSDSPTPYSVTTAGITLPTGSTFLDNGHVNIRMTSGKSAGIHFESKCIVRDDAECAGARHEAAQYIGTSFIPWSAFSVDITTDCVSWVQISNYNEHFGEGGQSPVGTTCSTQEEPDPKDPETPEPKIVVPNPPQRVDFCGTENDEIQIPSDTDDYYFVVSVEGDTTTVVAHAREGVTFRHGDDTTQSVTWILSLSDKPCDEDPVDPPAKEEPPVTPPTQVDPPSKTVTDASNPAPKKPAVLAETGGAINPTILVGGIALLGIGAAALATPILVRRARNS